MQALTQARFAEFFNAASSQDVGGSVIVLIPAGVEGIPDWAFQNCRSLARVSFPPGLASVGAGAFRNSGIEDAALPEGLEHAGDGAFAGCRLLTGLSLPDSLLYVPDHLCRDDVSLFSARLGRRCRSVGEHAFRGCVSLRSVEWPSVRFSVGASAFRDSGLVEADLPAGTASVGPYAFFGCCMLRRARVPAGCSVGPQAFGWCPSVREVVFEGRTWAQVSRMPAFPFGLKHGGLIRAGAGRVRITVSGPSVCDGDCEGD